MDENEKSIEQLLADYRPLVDKAIERNIPRTLDRARLAKAVGKPTYEFDELASQKAVNEPIWDLLDRGGKRWRPVLAILVAGCLGKKPEEVAEIAAATEVIHNGTLMVDDIEDGSTTRRGKPCTHIKYGVDVAVNAGNAMYFLAVLPLLNGNGKYDDKTLLKAYENYAIEMIRVSYGQAMDIHWHAGASNSVSEEQYLQMCAFKTGTIARLAAKWGAIFGGGNDAQVEAAGKFAESLGVAFQIQDDILNLEGEEGKYGKDPGGDITEGKRTLLVIRGLAKLPKQDAGKLITILDEHTADRKKITAAIGLLRSCGAFEYANGTARKIVQDAWKDFDRNYPDSKNKKALEKFARFVIERSA